MDHSELIEFAQRWSDLGWSVQAQVRDVFDKGADAHININAIELAQKKLCGIIDEIDEILESFIENFYKEEE